MHQKTRQLYGVYGKSTLNTKAHIKELEKIYHANTNQRKAEVKRSLLQENISARVPHRVLKYIRQQQIEL